MHFELLSCTDLKLDYSGDQEHKAGILAIVDRRTSDCDAVSSAAHKTSLPQSG